MARSPRPEQNRPERHSRERPIRDAEIEHVLDRHGWLSRGGLIRPHDQRGVSLPRVLSVVAGVGRVSERGRWYRGLTWLRFVKWSAYRDLVSFFSGTRLRSYSTKKAPKAGHVLASGEPRKELWVAVPVCNPRLIRWMRCRSTQRQREGFLLLPVALGVHPHRYRRCSHDRQLRGGSREAVLTFSEQHHTLLQIVRARVSVPLERSSGNRRLGHITKQGSSMLRFLLVEAAQVTVRSLPEWHSQYFRLMMRRGRKTAKVAMARRLAIRLYWMLYSGRGADIVMESISPTENCYLPSIPPPFSAAPLPVFF